MVRLGGTYGSPSTSSSTSTSTSSSSHSEENRGGYLQPDSRTTYRPSTHPSLGQQYQGHGSYTLQRGAMRSFEEGSTSTSLHPPPSQLNMAWSTSQGITKTMESTDPQPQSSSWSQRGLKAVRESTDYPAPDAVDKYGRKARWCGACHAAVLPGVSHHCMDTQPQVTAFPLQGGKQTVTAFPIHGSKAVSAGAYNTQGSKVPSTAFPQQGSKGSVATFPQQGMMDTSSKAADPILPVPPHADHEEYHEGVTGTSGPRILGRVPSLLPISQTSGHPISEGTRQGILVANPAFVKLKMASTSQTPVAGHREADVESALHVERSGGSMWSTGDKVPGGDASVDHERGGLLSGLRSGEEETGILFVGERERLDDRRLTGTERRIENERSSLTGGERRIENERGSLIGGERRTEGERNALMSTERQMESEQSGFIEREALTVDDRTTMHVRDRGGVRDSRQMGREREGVIDGRALTRREREAITEDRQALMGRELDTAAGDRHVMIPRDREGMEVDERGILAGRERTLVVECEGWDTPTSLISRLTAGLTARQQQERMDQQGPPSPSASEGSDMSNFFYQKETVQAEDPFLMAHQELMSETLKSDFQTGNQQAFSTRSCLPQDSGDYRSRKYPGSESTSSEPVCVDGSVCESQDSDLEDSRGSIRQSDTPYQPPDLATLLKSIRVPSLASYTADKENMSEYLEPEDIGHINHMIKSLSDAVLTINLPDTLYKDKGFTPLDYMDIHLNAVIRQFFFVFKNEDFLNLSVSDQIALLNGCSLAAVCSGGLYLFNQDSGCWRIPGAASHLNQPVIHISDLLQVYPQPFVTKLYQLHSSAARLDFDWPMGVITNCILMYTPIKQLMQEMDKIDVLRNKYVHLLLKYISWKHGHHNTSLVFPEVLKILDALLLLVDELSTLNLNLSQDEVLAVEERLSTLTMIQMAPLKCQSEMVKEAVASWSNLDSINLLDIHSRLCLVLQVSMFDSFQSSTAEYWAASSVYFTNFSHKGIPQLMPPSDASKDSPQMPGLEKHPPKPSDSYSLKDNSRMITHSLTKHSYGSSRLNTLGEKDLLLLRRFLEDVTTGREGGGLVDSIREKMDVSQIQMIIKKLCS